MNKGIRIWNEPQDKVIGAKDNLREDIQSKFHGGPQTPIDIL